MNTKDKEVLFYCDILDGTRDHVNLSAALARYHGVHPYTLGHGLIKSASVIGAAAVSTIFESDSEFETKLETASKVVDIFRNELVGLIIEVETDNHARAN